MTALRVWLRLDLRRRWPSLVALALLVAVAGGTTMTALAGARRGASSARRLLGGTLPADVAVLANTPDFDWAPMRALPEVAALTVFSIDYTVALEGEPSEAIAFPPLDSAVMRTIEKPIVYSGRLFNPRSAHEAVISRQFASQRHKSLGDTLILDLPSAKQLVDQSAETPAELAGPRVPLRIVGIIESPWFSDSTGRPGFVVMSPGVAATYPTSISGASPHQGPSNWANALVRLRHGEADVPRLRSDIQRLTGRSDIDVGDLDADYRAGQRSLTFEARCLVAFGLAALVTAIFLIGGAIARYASVATSELQTLRAVGLSRRQSVVMGCAGPIVAGVAGAVVASVIAWVASYWMPIGSASLIEPSPGHSIDWVVVGLGSAVVAVLVAAGAAIAALMAFSAGRRQAPARRSTVATWVARAGFAVPIVVGARLALESGRGRTAVPVRPALFGAVTGTLGIIAAFTFSHGVTDASNNPVRFGQTFQLVAEVGHNGHDEGPTNRLLQFAQGNKSIVGYDDAPSAVASGPGGDESITMYAYRNGDKALPVVVMSGRMARKPNEVVLAPPTLAAMHRHVGDTVTLAGSRSSRLMTIVGTGLVPEGPHNGYADGGWLTKAGYDSMFAGFKFHFVFVTLAPDARGRHGLQAVNAAATKFDPRLADAFEPADPPGELAELRAVQTLPLALGVFLALLAVGAVGHALATAVRRRSHDLAVLRSLGMTRGQCRAVIITQATVLALVGVVFGLPLGLALGRTVWRAVADYTPLEYVAPLAVLALLLVPPAALVLANLVAAWPGHRASRLKIAQILRAE